LSKGKPTYEELEKKIQELENDIKLNNSFLEMLFDAIPNPIFYKDKEGVYQHCNDSFSKTILGIDKDNIIGKTLYEFPEIIPTKNADIYDSKDKELMESHGTQFYESSVKCADGIERHYSFYKATFISESNEALGIVGVMLDISKHRKILKQLSELSITDSLTNLYNRRYFKEILDSKLVKLNIKKQKFAFMMIDIDFFKDYNDTFGHHQGDVALEMISHLIKRYFVRESDYVFRLGGEEFGILFSFSDIKNAVLIANKITANVEKLNLESGNKGVSEFLTISSGLGILDYPKSADLDADKIFELVDKLLYKSKKNGRNQISYQKINK